jgi:hypothetical protein
LGVAGVGECRDSLQLFSGVYFCWFDECGVTLHEIFPDVSDLMP